MSKTTKAQLQEMLSSRIDQVMYLISERDSLQKENAELRNTIKVCRDQFNILLWSGKWIKEKK